jgi:hypothetical protein
MANYRITNVTNLAGKREIGFNSTLSIDYVESMMKKSISIKPGETVFLQISSLPLSVHRLRVKKLITVVEVSDSEMKNNLNASRPMVIPKGVETAEETEKRITTSTPKKKTGKKSHEEESTDIQ